MQLGHEEDKELTRPTHTHTPLSSSEVSAVLYSIYGEGNHAGAL